MILFARSLFRSVLYSLMILIPFAGSSIADEKIPGIVALSGTDPDLPDAELRVIDPLVKGARFVAIGEAVHGSAGFIKMEHRLTRYLVERKGFRLIIFESPVMRSRGLTRWVEGCASGASKSKKLPIDLHQSPIDEDWDFYVWMCDFNRKNRNNPVRFRGMDIWDRPWEHQIEMERLTKKLRFNFGEQLALTRKHCWYHDEKDWSRSKEYMDILVREKKIPEVDYIPCTKSLKSMEKAVDQRLGRNLSDREYFDAHTLIQSIQTSFGYQANFNFAFQSFGKQWNSRDLAQAKNQYSIWEQEGEPRTVLVAHTSHATKMLSGSDWWKTGEGVFKSGVFFLRQWLGNSVRTIGLTGYDVTGKQGNYTKPTSPKSLDLFLHRRGYSVAYVDSYSKFITSQPRWWVHNENDKSHYTDGVYLIPRDNFDAFVFIDRSYKGNPILPWRDDWQW